MLAPEEPREGESSHARFCSGGGVSDGSAHHTLGGAVHKSYHHPCDLLTRVVDRTIQLSQQSNLRGPHLVP
jgi:hypothetical protein